MNLVPFQCYYAIDISLRFITDSSFFTTKTLAFFRYDIVTSFRCSTSLVPTLQQRLSFLGRRCDGKLGLVTSALVYLDSINSAFGTLLTFMKVYE